MNGEGAQGRKRGQRRLVKRVPNFICIKRKGGVKLSQMVTMISNAPYIKWSIFPPIVALSKIGPKNIMNNNNNDNNRYEEECE